MFDNEKMKALPGIETADIYTSHGRRLIQYLLPK
jgi:hypothetical protein